MILLRTSFLLPLLSRILTALALGAIDDNSFYQSAQPLQEIQSLNQGKYFESYSRFVDNGFTYSEAIQESPPAIYAPVSADRKSNLRDSFGFVPKFEVIYDWDIRDVRLAPGEYKAYNFSVLASDGEVSLTNSYANLAFVSSCLCTYPTVLDSNISDINNFIDVFISYGAGDSAFGWNYFEDGYFQDQNFAGPDAPMSTLLFLAATPIDGFIPDSTLDSDVFSLKVGFSVNDVPFQWDNSSFASIVGLDDDSAIFRTGQFNITASNGSNLTDSVVERAKSMTLQVFENTSSMVFNGLTKSFCAVQRADNDAVGENSFKTFLTPYENNEVFRKWTVVEGLNASTDYVAYVTSDVGGPDFPGVVYGKIEFTTDAEGTCELAYGLDFCSDVSYSIPQSAQYQIDGDRDVLLETYDNYARSIYENFTKAMDQINCDGTPDTLYSPIRSCDDCKASYKSWLCGMIFARCTTKEMAGYVLREVNASRSDFLNDVISPPSPYYEVMPCIDSCYHIVQDCPSDFSFSCPVGNTSILQSYGLLDSSVNYTSCNLVGGSVVLMSVGHRLMDNQICAVIFLWALVCLHFIV